MRIERIVYARHNKSGQPHKYFFILEQDERGFHVDGLEGTWVQLASNLDTPNFGLLNNPFEDPEFQALELIDESEYLNFIQSS